MFYCVEYVFSASDIGIQMMFFWIISKEAIRGGYLAQDSFLDVVGAQKIRHAGRVFWDIQQTPTSFHIG